MINRNSQVARGVRYALYVSAVATAATSLPALAQDQQEAAAGTSELGTVVVTGSRIPQPNLTSISPVTAVGNEEIKLEGVTRVEDLINNLPQAAADFGGNVSNGATGAATVNLRGLGSQRTLVLINNRRLMPGDPTQNGAASPDLNQIPGALIERVEVLTGGASAVYGADAVAGVVNFIMNDHFEGVRFDGQYSLYSHSQGNGAAQAALDARGFPSPDSSVTDGYTTDFNFIMGMNTGDGRGNATVYAGYRKLHALLQSERDFSACTMGSGDEFACSGSSTSATGRFFPVDQSPAAFGAPSTGASFTVDGSEFRPWGGAADQYNFGPVNYYQRPDERYTAGLFAHLDVSDHATAYAEFQFMDDSTVAQIAPSGLFLGSGIGLPPFFGNYLVNCSNPFLSAAQRSTLCDGVNKPATTDDVLVTIGRRNVEGGGRQDDLRHTSYRAVVGFRGDFAEAWTYDAYGQYGTTVYAENYLNDFSLSRALKALTVVNDPNPVSPTFGQPVCRVNVDAELTNDDPKCVPYNIFQAGGVTQDAVNYVSSPGFQEGSTKEIVVSGAVTGDLGHYGIKLPTADDGLGLAVGAEYRREESTLRTDQNFQTGDLLGQGSATLNTDGAYDVKELFTEVRVPLVQGKTGAETLSAEAGYRYSDYSLGFDTDTYKFGADWAPVEDIRLRGSYQRAVRAPNIQELFLQTRVQLDGQQDPCARDFATADPPEASPAECAFTGITAAQYGNVLANPAAQYNGLVGGNQDLNPETSDTYSYGFVFTPRFLPNFSWSLDYFDIKVEDLIGSVGADLILNNCMAGDPTFCALVHRAPGSGTLWLTTVGFIDDPIVNTGSLQVKGIDTELNYNFQMGSAGRLGLQLIGTYNDEYTVEPLTDAPTYDCVGLYGTVCGVPIPEWRHKFRATWTAPWNFDVSLSWRYVDETKLDATSSNPQLAGDVPPTDAKLKAMSYFDLAASYTFKESVTGRIGINNLTDEDPPLVGQSNCPSVYCNGNTFPQVYDTLGRYGFVSVTVDF